MNKEYAIVEVEWEDAMSSLDTMSISDMEKQEAPLSHSAGYLIKQDKKKVVLAFMTFGQNILDGDMIMKHYQIIPKGMIKKIKYLERKKQK